MNPTQVEGPSSRGGRRDGRPSFLIRNPAGQPSLEDEFAFEQAMLAYGGRYDIMHRMTTSRTVSWISAGGARYCLTAW